MLARTTPGRDHFRVDPQTVKESVVRRKFDDLRLARTTPGRDHFRVDPQIVMTVLSFDDEGPRMQPQE
jgi:hypothetical protein